MRPAALQKVASPQLAELINVCISPREQRPRSRQLLKHPYFDSIRQAQPMVSSKSEAALLSAGLPPGDALCCGPPAALGNGHAPPRAAAGAAAQGGEAHPGAVSSSSSSSASLAAQAGAGAGAPGGPSRTVSALTEGGQSEAGSLRSQRSNISELATAVLADIQEEEASPGRGRGSGSPSPFAGSPPGQGSPAGARSPTVASPAGSEREETWCEATDRHFAVMGDYEEGADRFNLRLRIREPTGERAAAAAAAGRLLLPWRSEPCPPVGPEC